MYFVEQFGCQWKIISDSYREKYFKNRTIDAIKRKYERIESKGKLPKYINLAKKLKIGQRFGNNDLNEIHNLCKDEKSPNDNGENEENKVDETLIETSLNIFLYNSLKLCPYFYFINY